MIVFRIEALPEAVQKAATMTANELYNSGEWQFSKRYDDLTAEDHEFAKSLDAEETEYYLAATPASREVIRKSNPDSPVGEEEEVAVEVAAPDGSVSQVAVAKPAGESVSVSTPEIDITSAPAGTATSVTKAYEGDYDMDGFEQAAYAQPIYKARDGSLYYKETEAKLAAKIDDMEEEKEKEKVAAKTEKAFNLYPDAPRSIVKHLVATGASSEVFKDLAEPVPAARR